jgi:hypothetical protein
MSIMYSVQYYIWYGISYILIDIVLKYDQITSKHYKFQGVELTPKMLFCHRLLFCQQKRWENNTWSFNSCKFTVKVVQYYIEYSL